MTSQIIDKAAFSGIGRTNNSNLYPLKDMLVACANIHQLGKPMIDKTQVISQIIRDIHGHVALVIKINGCFNTRRHLDQ